MHGRRNDLIERLREDPAFANVDFKRALDARRFVGLARQQVDQFCRTVVGPIVKRYASVRNKAVTLSV